MSTQAALGTLGFHLDGRPCRVGCAYCYLGGRRSDAPVPLGRAARAADAALVGAVAASAAARDVAIAVSEPARTWRAGIEAIVAAASARGLAIAITTTPQVVAEDPWVLDGASRLTVSVDPAKGEVDVVALRRILAAVARPGLEIIALPSLVSPAYCDRLAGGLVAELLDAPEVAGVGLNGLKPPPPWCDRRFWIGFLARLRPLLDLHLGRRLHLDCYVAARILGLGACPAKPDVSAGGQFRACVYQAAPDFVFEDATELARRTVGYRPPDECPFEIR